MLAIDTETLLFSAELPAPPVVCVSFDDGTHQALHHAKLGTGLDAFEHAVRGQEVIVGHNIAYDMRGLMANKPSATPAIFAAYKAGRILDTQVMCALHDIEKHGELGGWVAKHNGKRTVATYSLAALADRFLGVTMKGKGTTQTSYGDLLDVPVEAWPRDSVEYAISDATNTLKVAQHFVALGFPSLVNTAPQTYAAFCLSLMSAWGLTTHEPGVRELRRIVESEMAECMAVLIPAGLATYKRGVPRGARKLHKEVAAFYSPGYLGTENPVGAYAEAITNHVPKNAHCAELKREAKLAGHLYARFGGHETTKGGAPSTKGEHLKALDVPLLTAFADSGALSTQLSTQLPALEMGTTFPIHSHFKVLQVTGRTSSADPNVQNQSKRPGFRECFVPRPGNYYFQADYSSFELFALAQVCLAVLGYSRLGEALNAGQDPHAIVGAQALGVTYEDFMVRLAADDAECDTARQMGKIANFGLAGLLSPKSLVQYAKDVYGMAITLDQARMIERMWHAAWPEMRPYFAWVKRCTGRRTGPIHQLYTGRIRGNCRATQGANTPFQGLAADAAKEAMCLIFEACYSLTSSPLFGSRIVNFVHDEFIGEARIHRAAECAEELSRLMVVGASRLMPDMRLRAEPCLMRFWSKKAKTLRDEKGRLQVWPLVA